MITPEQARQIAQYINDRFGFVAAQFQSDYKPDPVQLERWKQLGLVPQAVTPETFAMSIPAELHLLRNAFIMGRLAEAVEAGTSYEAVLQAALTLPLRKPDFYAIAVAEQQTAMYITDNAADLATKVGQIAIKQRNDTIRKMAVEYHNQTLKRKVLDEDKKRERFTEHPEEEEAFNTGRKYAGTWQEFASELHHTLDDKARDLDRVAYYEITDAQLVGKGNELLAEIGPDGYVYKRPLASACPHCKHAYLKPDGVTPKLFRLSELIMNGSNIGRKAHPTKGGKVNPIPREDGAETLKPTIGLMHPWCACRLYEAFGYEKFLTDEEKQMVKDQKKKGIA